MAEPLTKSYDYDLRKLNGRVIEIFGTQAKFADAMGVTDATMSKKLNGLTPFSQTEISKGIELLELKIEDIPAYFFTFKVSISTT